MPTIDTAGLVTTTAPLARIGGAPVPRTAVVVLGMHRSGTSALTRVISLLGAALPKNILGAGPGNEAGHWESRPLIAFHDRMLSELGSRWDDWRAFDVDRIDPGKRSEIKREISVILSEEYGSAPLFVLKEPRICRFLPLYAEIFAEENIAPHYVLPIRNPLAVAASLAKRDGMSEAFSALLWLRHAIDAERATRGTPRTVVSYETLMADWRMVLSKVSSSFPIGWPRSLAEVQPEVDAFVKSELRHHAPSREELAGRSDIPSYAKDAYSALLTLEAKPDDRAAMATLDGINASFSSAAQVFGPATFLEIAARERSATNKIAAAERTYNAEIERLSIELAGRDAEIAQLRVEPAARDAEIARLRVELAARDAEIARLGVEHISHDATIGDMRRQAAELRDQLANEKAEATALKQKLATQKNELRALESNVGPTAAAVQDLTARLAAGESHVSALSAELKAHRESLSWQFTKPMRLVSRWLRIFAGHVMSLGERNTKTRD